MKPYHDPADEPSAAPLPAEFFDFEAISGSQGEKQGSKEALKGAVVVVF